MAPKSPVLDYAPQSQALDPPSSVRKVESTPLGLIAGEYTCLAALAQILFSNSGGARNFPTGGLTLPTRGLKYGFKGSVNAKNLRQNSFSPSEGGL